MVEKYVCFEHAVQSETERIVTGDYEHRTCQAIDLIPATEAYDVQSPCAMPANCKIIEAA